MVETDSHANAYEARSLESIMNTFKLTVTEDIRMFLGIDITFTSKSIQLHWKT